MREASKSTGIGGGITLGRRCSTTDLAAAGCVMLIPRCPLGEEDGEAEGELGVLMLSDRGPLLVATLTLAFLPLAECHALQ